MALVRGACPHDCPDTCAMHVTVEDGRATKVAGDPEHPITVGFLCGKVSNYLERVYSDERILRPLVREDGDFRRASWEEAIDIAAEGLLRARDAFGGESILPYSYMGTQGLIQGNVMSARVMNALGASNLERTICATAGYVGTAMAHGISPEVDPEEWPNARYLLVWGWNPLSTAPHLWRKLLDARKQGARLVVVDPFRSRTARVADEHLRPLPGTDAALAIGMMRAIVDAGLQDEDWCRAHADGYDELLAELDRTSVEECAATCGVDAEAIARVGREFASTRPALLRLGVGAQRHAGAPAAYSTIASLPALTGAWKDRGGGCSYIPLATAGAISSHPLELEDLRERPGRTINMSRLGEALTDPALDPPVKALVCWNSNPAAIAPDQERVLEGLRRDDLFTVVLEQFMTDTAQHADVVLPATTQLEHLDVLFSWGHHYVTWNEPAIEPVGEAKPNTETFRLLADRLGLDDPCFSETDSELVDALLENFSENGLRERGWTKVDLGQGPVPHARRRLRHRDGPRGSACALRGARRGCGQRAGGALPARADHAEDASLPQLHLREPAPPARGAAGARARDQPGGRVATRHRGRRPRARVQRPRRVRMRRPRVRRRAPRRAGRADGLVEPRLRGRPQRAGHDAAAADRGRKRADLQRQPRGGANPQGGLTPLRVGQRIRS